MNTMIGLVSSHYQTFNWVMNDVIILLNTLIITSLSTSKQKDGFKISLNILLPIVGIVQFILILFAENYFVDNNLLIVVLSLFMIQALFILFGKVFSKFVD